MFPQTALQTLAASAIGLLVLGMAHGFSAEVAEPQSYRLDEYRAPVPPGLAGATVVDTTEAERLWRDKQAVFVDVMPRRPRPPNLPASTVWRDKERRGIPGSTWLPNVGYGDLSVEAERYFADGLTALTSGDRSRKLVFYCLADCWMSWNAAKRALAMGYSEVIWFREGTDGWAAAGLPLETHLPFGKDPY